MKTLLITLALTLSLPAFADAPREGGHDGGGGGLVDSTPAQVRDAIRSTFAEIEESKTKSNPGWLFMSSIYGPEVRDASGDMVKALLCIKSPVLCKDPDSLFDGTPNYFHAWDYLKLSAVELKEDGPCPASDKSNAAASVSEFRIGARLCFSIPVLVKTTPTALKAQISALLVHEMAHLLGYDEQIAQGVQEAVLVNYAAITRRDGQFLKYRVRVQLMTVDSALKNSRSNSIGQDLGMRLYLVGYSAGVLNTVLEMLPDDINDRTIPVARPEMFPEVKRAIQKLVDLHLDLAQRGTRLSASEYDAEANKLIAEVKNFEPMLEQFLGK